MAHGNGGRFAEGGKEALRESETAEEEASIDGVSCKGVPEEGDSGNVAGDEARGTARVGEAKSPDRKIGDKEKLDGSEESGGADTSKGAAVTQPKSDGLTVDKTGVYDGHQFLKTNEHVADEESQGAERSRRYDGRG